MLTGLHCSSELSMHGGTSSGLLGGMFAVVAIELVDVKTQNTVLSDAKSFLLLLFCPVYGTGTHSGNWIRHNCTFAFAFLWIWQLE